jgi:BirA family biotin operon repressor/biotin-[acetyl-CoA-carboxylase] ligase
LSLATPFNILGEPLIELLSIDSTNMYAMAQIQEGLAISGSCYRADFQTNGKGQQSKIWGSELGQNLLCSYVLGLKQLKEAGIIPKNMNLQQQFGLSVAISLGLTDYFSKIAGFDTKIKWPNDLYWHDRKAGGILIENTVRGTDWNWSVIGIGVNINQTNFSADLPNPVSLKQITGEESNVNEQLRQLTNWLNKRLIEWVDGNFEAMLATYNKRLYKKGKEVKFKNNNISFTGTVIGVNTSGQLIINHGIEQAYNFGEIVWEQESLNK